jgi:hypothetical protein
MRVFRQKDSCIAVGSVCLSHVQGWKGAESRQPQYSGPEGRRLWNCGEEGYLNICTLFGESH